MGRVKVFEERNTRFFGEHEGLLEQQGDAARRQPDEGGAEVLVPTPVTQDVPALEVFGVARRFAHPEYTCYVWIGSVLPQFYRVAGSVRLFEGKLQFLRAVSKSE